MVLPASPPIKAYPRQQAPPAAGARTNPSAATSNVALHAALHVPFAHVPAHGRLQPPQWLLLLFVSTHALPHSIWPAVGQTQLLFVHVAPAGQALQPPQRRGVPSPPGGMHAPSGHFV